MQRYQNVAQDALGNIIQGMSVSVFLQGTQTLATIYSDNGITTKPNPTTTDALGTFFFYAANGHYDLQLTKTGLPTTQILDVILFDPGSFVSGQVLFGTGAGLAQDPKLFWDSTNHRMGLGLPANTPRATLETFGTILISNGSQVTGAVASLTVGGAAGNWLGAGIRLGADFVRDWGWRTESNGSYAIWDMDANAGAGAIRFSMTSAVGAVSLSGIGPHVVGAAAGLGQVQWQQTGTFTGAGASAQGFFLSPTLITVVGGDEYGMHIAPTLNKAASGAHPDFIGLLVNIPPIGAGGATITNATTLKVQGAPADGINRRALWVVAGQSDFDGGPTRFGGVGTTASAANAFLDNAASNNLLRSTSSLRYKTDIADLMDSDLLVLDQVRLVRYRSLSEHDDQRRFHYGMLAEDVYVVNPILTSTTKLPILDGVDLDVPDWVQYERFIPLLIEQGRRDRKRIAELEAKLQ